MSPVRSFLELIACTVRATGRDARHRVRAVLIVTPQPRLLAPPCIQGCRCLITRSALCCAPCAVTGFNQFSLSALHS